MAEGFWKDIIGISRKGDLTIEAGKLRKTTGLGRWVLGMNPWRHPPLFVNRVRPGAEGKQWTEVKIGREAVVESCSGQSWTNHFTSQGLNFLLTQCGTVELNGGLSSPLLAAVLGDEAISEVKSPLCKIKAQVLPHCLLGQALCLFMLCLTREDIGGKVAWQWTKLHQILSFLSALREFSFIFLHNCNSWKINFVIILYNIRPVTITA